MRTTDHNFNTQSITEFKFSNTADYGPRTKYLKKNTQIQLTLHYGLRTTDQLLYDSISNWTGILKLLYVIATENESIYL